MTKGKPGQIKYIANSCLSKQLKIQGSRSMKKDHDIEFKITVC